MKKIIHSFVYLIFIFFSEIRIYFRHSSKRNFFKKVNIFSVHSNSGLGLVSLFLFNAIPPKLKGVKFFLESKINNFKNFDSSINIFVGNPDILIPFFFKILKFKMFKNYNIGYWFWELDKIPYKWKLYKNFIDEIWVNSEYTLNAFKDISKNIVKIPFYVDLGSYTRYSKKELQLPDNKFIFIFTFDFSSYYHRKNPESIIDAFNLAFQESNEVFLLIKTINGEKNPKYFSRLKTIVSKYKNIDFRNKFLSRDKQISLILNSDCYVSLHRAEGLGLGMAEAMYLKKPVIATNYSGNLEFMNKSNSCLVKYKRIGISDEQYIYGNSQYWAEPDVSHASFFMKKIKEDKNFRRKISQQGFVDIRKKFNKKIYRNFIDEKLKEFE